MKEHEIDKPETYEKNNFIYACIAGRFCSRTERRTGLG